MLQNRSFILAAALMVAVGATTGCSAKKQPTANAKVSVDTSAIIGSVGSIKLTISGTGMSDVTTQLTRAAAGNVWTGNVTNIPAAPAPGSGRLFKAEAFDTATPPVKIYDGETTATVIAGQTAQVTIILQEVNPPPGPTNYAPRITSITSTNAYVLPSQTGTFAATAEDPDHNGEPLAFAWSAACTTGAISLATPNAASTAFVAPSQNAICTVSIKVTEASSPGNGNSPLSVMTYFTITVNANFGDADIFAFPNSFPLVSVRGDFRYNFFSDVTTMPVGQQGDLFFSAIDPDGDSVRYDLVGKCAATLPHRNPATGLVDHAALLADATVPFLSSTYFSAVTLASAAGTVAPPTPASSTWSPTFGHPAPPVATFNDANQDCVFWVTVQDLCTAGNCGQPAACGGAGQPPCAQGSLPDGADKVTTIGGIDMKSVTTGVINATHPAQPRRAPAIVRVSAPNQLGGPANGQTWDPKRIAIVQPGTLYNLMAEAKDEYEPGPLTVAWSCSATNPSVASGYGTLGTPVDSSPTAKELKSEITWTSPGTLGLGMQCTATFTSTASTLATVVTFKFASSDPCAGQANGTICDDLNACTTGETCQAGVCTVPTGGTTACGASDQCHVAGVCDPATGVCSNPNAENGVACNADASGCTAGDSCQAGTCVAGAAPACNTPPNSFCYLAAGSCASTGDTSFVCNYAANTGATCSSANAADKCFNSFTCDATGACLGVGADPVSCTASACTTGGTCQPATGTCTGGANQPNGTPCNADSSLCTDPDSCQGGVCTPGAAVCAADQSCDPASGACTEQAVANKIAKAIEVNRVDGLAAGAAASYLSGTSVFFPAKAVDGITIAGAGGSDVFLAAYDMATGLPMWAKAYGDELDQFGKDSTATTADGTVAAIGRVAAGARLGECTTVGTTTTCSGVVFTNPGTFETDFLLLANAATGAMKAGTRAINNGISGALNSVAVNPTLNLIAVCGQVSATSELTPGVVYQGGATDLLVAVFNSAGALQWARQYGSATGVGDESCNAVAIADDGTVYAAGKYQDELDLGTGPLPSLNNVVNVRHMWLAHFGGTGTTLAATAFGTPALRCANNPVQACTVATAAADCGTGVCNANPVGNVTANDLELDTAGNLVLGGNFTANFPVGALVSAGGTDAFVVKLSPAFAPAWGVRLGNTNADATNAVAIAPFDNVIAVGSYAATTSGTPTTGAAALTAPAGGANNVFVLKLDGATGATHSAGGYGDASGQLASDVAVRGNRVQFGGITAGVLDFGAPTTPISTGTTSTAFTTFADIQ